MHFMREVFLFYCLFVFPAISNVLHTEEVLKNTKDMNEQITGYRILGGNLFISWSVGTGPCQCL